MSPVLVLIFVLAVFALMILGGVAAYRSAKARRETLAALAARLGLTYTAGDDGVVERRYGHFDLFRRGQRRHASNTLHGTVTVDGRPVLVTLGDWTYTTTSGTGKDRKTHTHRLSYLVAEPPHPIAGTLAVRPENVFDKFAGAIGFEDIDFESAEFSKRFHVSATDRKFAYALLDPRMVEYFLAAEPPSLTAEQGHVLLTRGAGRWKVEEFEATLAWAQGFVERWPRHLISQ